MVRRYKKIPGTRNYRDYTLEKLQQCLQAIAGGMSIAEASRKYKIHRNTISNKIHKKHVKRAGKLLFFFYKDFSNELIKRFNT
uniref:HTH psq-type domain-containing protein n=1 Tax=Parasteatoda tepidariorum TaxID=114398 RepID=A0A2L2Y2L5_PARTP